MRNLLGPPREAGRFRRVARLIVWWCSIAVVGLSAKYQLVTPLLDSGLATRLQFSKGLVGLLIALLVLGGALGFVATDVICRRPRPLWWGAHLLATIGGLTASLLVGVAFGHLRLSDNAAQAFIPIAVAVIAATIGALARRVMVAGTALAGWSRARAVFWLLVAISAAPLVPAAGSYENAWLWISGLAFAYVLVFDALPLPAARQ